MQFEYKAVKLETTGILGGIFNADQCEKYLNTLGTDGWELISGFDTNLEGGRTRDVVLIFKRPK